MNTAFRGLTGLLLLSLMGACSSPKAVAPESTRTRIDGTPRTDHSQVGVEMLTWHLKDSDNFDGILAQSGQPALPDDVQVQLTSNALTVTRLSESDLGPLLTELGGTSAARSTWCGQVVDWRDIRDVRVSQAIIDIDQQPILLDSGQLSMAARAWIEPTLDSARMRVEIVPRYRTDRRASPSILRANKPEIHAFADLVTSTEIAPGEVLLVTCTMPPSLVAVELPPEPPASPPTDDADVDDADPEDDPAFDTPAPRSKRLMTRPLNLGHALFSIPISIPGEPPERVVVVLVPRVPARMIPEGAAASPTQQAARGVEVGR